MQPPDADLEEAAGWTCTSCGAAIEGVVDRPYPYGDDDALCYGCSVIRGGVYDDHYDRWTTAPDLRGLARSEP